MAMIETETALTTSVKFPQYYYQFRVIHNALVKISFTYIFLIATIGFITNTSTVLLLSKNVITKNFKNKYTLIALALSDLLFNIALLIRGIHDVFKGNYDNLCLVISFLSHLAELLSAFYTVTFTIQRYTAVRHPLKAAIDRHSSPIFIIVLIFILCSIFCFALCSKNSYIDCHEELNLIWFISDALLSFVIPFFIILIYNILIVNFIRKHSLSPITVQSTLRRTRLQSNGDKMYNVDGISMLENNVTNGNDSFIHNDENRNVQIKFYKRDRRSSVEIINQRNRSSISSLFNRIGRKKPMNQFQFENRLRPFIFSKLNSHFNETILHYPFAYPYSKRLSHQSTDSDLFSRISRRTYQSIRVTRMLVLVSTCFLILNAPAHLCVITLKIYTSIDVPAFNEHNHIIFNQPKINTTLCEAMHNCSNYEIYNTIHNQTVLSSLKNERIIEDRLAIHLIYLAILLTQLISYASYSINFFLYSFSGVAFRTSLRQLINTFRGH